jgi:ATP phosphoribosyltransferase
MNNIIDTVTDARLLLVPKGDDSQPCLQAFEKATGITVPEFKDRKLEATADGKTFFKVKGRDIPRLIAAGYGDIGLTGSDSCEDYMAYGNDNSVAYQSFDSRMCRFALLAPSAKAAVVRQQLQSNQRYLSVATSFPRLLGKYAQAEGLKLLPTELAVAGSVEIMPRLLNVPLVADLVSSGATAKANGLVEIMSLSDVYPALVIRATPAVGRLEPVSYLDIDRIDATLSRRSLQVNDLTVSSYTLGLMRDSNEAGKKAGEEFSEVLMAIFGDGSIKDCESEIADLIYVQIVSAYSRDKPVKLENVIRMLIERNQLGSKT